MKFTFTQDRLIKMSKKQFVGFRAGRPGFLLGGVKVKRYYCSSVTAQGECDPKGLRRTTFAHSKHRTLVLVLSSSGGQSCCCCSLCNFDHDVRLRGGEVGC